MLSSLFDHFVLQAGIANEFVELVEGAVRNVFDHPPESFEQFWKTIGAMGLVEFVLNHWAWTGAAILAIIVYGASTSKG